MKKILILATLFIVGCMEKSKRSETEQGVSNTITTEDYELVKSDNSKALLILFPGGGTTSKEIKEEFDILKIASAKDISVLLMNFNRHLWITDEDSEQLTKVINEAVRKNDINKKKIYMGGMSIGGNVALTLSNYLYRSKSSIRPEGVFIVDSPIDLFALYESGQKDLRRKDYSEERLAEPKFIVGLIEDEFGSKDTLLAKIQEMAPVTLKTDNTANIQALKNSKLRFYTEPDTLWWKNVRQTDFESTNAYTIQKTAKILKVGNWNNFQLIQTTDRGYRSNGDRHPHSWSIVDTEDLTDWILE